MRQETNGPQAEQLELSSVDRYSKIAGAREEVSPTQIKDRDHISHSQGQGDLPDYTCAERLLRGQKRGGITP